MKKNYVRLILGAALLIGSILLVLWLHWADFHVYYSAGHSLLRGRTDLYAADFADSQIMDYRYPLFFLVLFLPFCYLPYQTAEFVWLWFNLLILGWTILAMKRGLELIGLKFARINLIFLISLLICAKYFIVSMRILNAHLLVLCLVFAAFYLLLKKRQISAAWLMALAITFKIVPVLLLPYFAVKKQWRFLIATAALVIVFNLLPAVYYGFDQNQQMLVDWRNHVMVNNEFHNVNGPINVSLQGQLERYLTETDYARRIEDPNYPQINWLSLAPEFVDALAKIVSALLLAATLCVLWMAAKMRKESSAAPPTFKFTNFKFGKSDDSQKFSAAETSPAFDSLAYHEFGFAICLMLLIEPRTNVYYLLALFLPLAAFLISLARRRSAFNIAVFIVILMIACLLPLVPGATVQRLLLVVGVDFYLTLILWLALGYNIVADSRKIQLSNDEMNDLEYNRVAI